MTTILECKGIVKTFGALRAVNDVNFSMRRGEIVGLIGPNGAGKSTLFNIIAGVLKPSAGRVAFQGADITDLPAYRRTTQGISKTFQVPAPFATLTTLENLLVAAMYGANKIEQEARSLCAEVLDFVGLREKQHVRAEQMSVADRRRLDLGRALASGPELLLLDESLAGLTPTEVKESIELLGKVREQGKTLIIVEHLMRAIVDLADRVIVLNQGSKIAEGKPREVLQDPHVVEAYLGTANDA